MNNWKRKLKDYTVPEVKREKIESLVELCATYLPKTIDDRFEISKVKQALMVTFSGKKSWLLLELLVSVIFLFGIYHIVKDQALFFITFISSLMTFILILSFLQNISYGTWEIEKTCMISTEKVLLYKIMIIGLLHMVLLFFLSLYTFFLTPYDFVTILCYGFFPFFLSFALLFHLSIYFHSKMLFLGIFICVNIISFLLISSFHAISSIALSVAILISSIVYFLFSIHKYFIKMEEEGGCLLWN